MTDDVRARSLDINPTVPHHLVCEVAGFRQTHRVHFAAATIVLLAPMMRVRIREDDVDAAGADACSRAGPFAPVVVPARDVLDGMRILIAIVSTRVLSLVQWSNSIFVKRWRELIPVFAQAFVARILHGP